MNPKEYEEISSPVVDEHLSVSFHRYDFETRRDL
jgi:hypothetical protein